MKSIRIADQLKRFYGHSSIRYSSSKYVDVVFVRDCQCSWSKENVFIGWTDSPLTKQGVLEARLAGKLMKDAELRFYSAHTSLLRRATKSTWMMIQELEQEWILVHPTWKLNEQQYGALVGKNKKEIVSQYGRERVEIWRHAWNSKCSPMSPDHKHWPGDDKRYKMYGLDNVPSSETLTEVADRALEYWKEAIVPQIKQGKSVLIVAHRQSLRGLLKHVDDIPMEDLVKLEIPRAYPLVYRFDTETLKPVPIREKDIPPASLAVGACKQRPLSGYYLGDPMDIDKAIEQEHRQVYDLSVWDDVEEHPEYLQRLYDRWTKAMLRTFSGPNWASGVVQNDNPLSWSKNDKELGISVEKSLKDKSIAPK